MEIDESPRQLLGREARAWTVTTQSLDTIGTSALATRGLQDFEQGHALARWKRSGVDPQPVRAAPARFLRAAGAGEIVSGGLRQTREALAHGPPASDHHRHDRIILNA